MTTPLGAGVGQAAIEELDRLLATGAIAGGAWYDGARRVLEDSYLASDDPYPQSGMRADAARWERGRRPIARAIDRDGTFLDIGCANGLLMESVQRWAAADGHAIEPCGLDYSPALADLARRRRPGWSDRVFVGNVADWAPPRRFDYVRTELEYVPPARQAALVERLLSVFLRPAGRLIVRSYGSSRRPAPRTEPVGDILRSWGHTVAGETAGADDNAVVFVRVAWLDTAPRSSRPVPPVVLHLPDHQPNVDRPATRAPCGRPTSNRRAWARHWAC